MDLLAQHWELLVAMIAAGALAGLLAGLFGIGGGGVIVPVLYALLGIYGFSDDVRMKTAVATSLATIIITSWRSVRSHYKHGSVDVEILRTWAPWIMLGGGIGAIVASNLSAVILVFFFGLFLLFMSIHMAFGKAHWKLVDQMPRGWKRAGIGSGIGFFSAMAGVGGGVFGVITMTLCGQSIHRAVGTSAGFGAAIGIPATLLFMVTGQYSHAQMVPFSIGYVNIPGFVLISTLTATMAPFGAKLAHSLPEAGLRRAFAVLLVVVGGLMLRDALFA